MTSSQEIKEKIRERYTRVALTGDSCCDPITNIRNERGCCSEVSKLVGYDRKDLKSIPEGSILGAVCVWDAYQVCIY
jgi:hypothetical protein